VVAPLINLTNSGSSVIYKVAVAHLLLRPVAKQLAIAKGGFPGLGWRITISYGYWILGLHFVA